VSDDRTYLLPQGKKFEQLGPKCFDLRHGKIPELVVSFLDERKLRLELWKLHELASGSAKVEIDAARANMENCYRAVLGLKKEEKIPLRNIQTAMDFKIPKEAQKLMGKTYRFRGLGKSFLLDRIYIRQKLHEILTGYSFYTSNLLVKMPCKILDGKKELVDVCGAFVPDLKVTHIVQNANVVVVALDKRGITLELAHLLKSTGYLQKVLQAPEQHKLVFVELSENVEMKPPAYLFQPDTQIQSDNYR
jgi:hypothetical protein